MKLPCKRAPLCLREDDAFVTQSCASATTGYGGMPSLISPPNSARESYGQGPLAPWVSSANCQADGSSGQVGCTLFVCLPDCLAGVIAAG